jgi:outer membrane protein TolC
LFPEVSVRGLRWHQLLSAVLVVLSIEGCAVGPNYLRPDARAPAAFKEQVATPRHGWKNATPLDLMDRGPWWGIYKDPALSNLASQVELSNQTVAAAAAAYQQAREVIRRASQCR